MAQLIEIGLFFKTVLNEEGQTKLLHTILATDAALVSYTAEDYIFNVQYESPNRLDSPLVPKNVKEETTDFPVLNVYVNEQSDKEYYMVKVALNVRERDHAALESEILTRFIRLQRKPSREEEARGKEHAVVEN